VQKWWSYLFGGVTLAAVLLFVVAPFVGWWLPKNVSTFGGKVDGLFYLILAITGFFFVLIECLLVYFMYVYAGEPGTREHVFGHHYAEKKVFWTSFFKSIARPVTAVIHNQHRLELFWTLVPAVILLFIAFVQVNTWAEIKYQTNMPKPNGETQQLQVDARQFEWRIRYPSVARRNSWKADPESAAYEPPERFGRDSHMDDVHQVNDLHVYKGQKVLVTLTTRDVIHSFYLPNMRLKQDALPGKVIPVWFQATEANTKYDETTRSWVDGYNLQTKEKESQQIWELACAELCGWGHYKMRGRLYVHETEADFVEWLKATEKEQNRTQPEIITTTASR
jgi:cytochrome c oxidase subunit 2